MAHLRFRRSALILNLAGLAIGTAGGALFEWIGTPIPWLLGSLLTVAAVNLGGWRIRCPEGGRQIGQIFIGTVIGLYFTPAVGAVVVGQFPWMVAVAVVSLAVGLLGAVLQVRIAGLDRASAFLASVPGGMAEMIALADKLKADPVSLAVSQLVRVTIILVTIPAFITYLGEPGTDLFTPAVRDVDTAGLALLLGGAAAVTLVLNWVGITNAWMLGACGFAAGITLAEISLSAMPPELLIAAQVLIGVSVGQRFEREAMARAPRVILSASITTVVLIAMSVVLAAIVASATEISIWSMITATAPGGLAEMSITAQLLGLGVPLVTAYHVTRVFLITLLALPAYRFAQRLGTRPLP